MLMTHPHPTASSPLGGALVRDAMREAVLSCPPDASLRSVAALMAGHRVHCIVVEGAEPDRDDWRLVSHMDVVRIVDAGLGDLPAGQAAGTEFVSVTPTDELAAAARRMVEHDVAHVVVVDRGSRRPIGVLSSLDIAGYVARHAPAVSS